MSKPEMAFGMVSQEWCMKSVYPYEIFLKITAGLAMSAPGVGIKLNTHRGSVITGTIADTDGELYTITVAPKGEPRG